MVAEDIIIAVNGEKVKSEQDLVFAVNDSRILIDLIIGRKWFNFLYSLICGLMHTIQSFNLGIYFKSMLFNLEIKLNLMFNPTF